MCVNFQVLAEEMLSQVIHWIRVDDSSLGGDKLEGVPPAEELGRPMMLLNVLTEFCGSNDLLRKRYLDDIEWAVTQILKHVSQGGGDVGGGNVWVFCSVPIFCKLHLKRTYFSN